MTLPYKFEPQPVGEGFVMAHFCCQTEIKNTEKISENLKIILYNRVNSWYDNQAGLKPDAITMPAAQFREKAVFFAVHHPPSTWRKENIKKRWKLP